MRFWFSQVPVYPQRVRDVLGLVFDSAGATIAAVVVCLALPDETLDVQTARLLAWVGAWLLFSVLLLLAGRIWAQRRRLPFVPRKEATALNSVTKETRTLPVVLLWKLLPSGLSGGLILAQIKSGHPFWQVGNVSWATVATFASSYALIGVLHRVWASSRSGRQTGASA